MAYNNPAIKLQWHITKKTIFPSTLQSTIKLSHTVIRLFNSLLYNSRTFQLISLTLSLSQRPIRTRSRASYSNFLWRRPFVHPTWRLQARRVAKPSRNRSPQLVSRPKFYSLGASAIYTSCRWQRRAKGDVTREILVLLLSDGRPRRVIGN